LSFAARFAAPTRDELGAVARKYDALADLRERRERGGGVAPRTELLALAREFPGALRELDALPRAEIEARRASLRGALSGEPPAPWMTWMIAYHATMRAALYVKARLAQESPSDGRALAEDAARRFALPIDEAFVRAVERPPAGRVNAAVFERLGRDLGVPADEMWQALFPTRRANRFER
jgi:hypothetical protein